MVLKVNNLNKSFKDKKVLKDVSFQLKEGEILALLGHSGAGKTTVLRCVNMLETCDSGSIEIDGSFLCRDEKGKSVYAKKEEITAIRKKLGMVFQNFNLFPHLSVLENIIEAPVKAFGMDKAQAIEKAMELLKKMGLQERAKAYPCELSGGQKQRVAIARACILNPKIMCFDEPTSALDPELTEGVASIIEELAKEGMSVLIITHDMAFAKRVAQKVIFMEDGQIIEEGTKEEIFTNPKKDRTKSFITS